MNAIKDRSWQQEIAVTSSTEINEMIDKNLTDIIDENFNDAVREQLMEETAYLAKIILRRTK